MFDELDYEILTLEAELLLRKVTAVTEADDGRSNLVSYAPEGAFSGAPSIQEGSTTRRKRYTPQLSLDL